jgi:hypothetical protein
MRRLTQELTPIRIMKINRGHRFHCRGFIPGDDANWAVIANQTATPINTAHSANLIVGPGPSAASASRHRHATRHGFPR